MSTSDTALSCHMVMPGGHPGDDFLIGVTKALKETFRIGHSTLQIEISETIGFALEPEDVI